jgi:hypothetical protein
LDGDRSITDKYELMVIVRERGRFLAGKLSIL